MDENDDVILLGIPEESDRELDLLGKRFSIPMTKNIRQFAKAAANLRMKKSFQFRNLNKGQRELNVKVNELPEQTQNQIKKKNIQLFDGNYYIRKQISGGGADTVIQLFDDTIDKVVGICNISKQKLPEYVNLILQRIEGGYYNHATLTDAKLALYEPFEYGTTDIALMNSELEITVGGSSLLRVPINRIVEGIEGDINSLLNGYNIEAPKLVVEQQNIQALLHMPAAFQLAGNHFIEIKFIGNETRLKNTMR